MTLNFKTVLLVMGFVTLVSVSSSAANFCLAHEEFMPDFAISYSYIAHCSWSEKAISKTTPSLPGWVSQKTRDKLKSHVSQKLSQAGVHEIEKVGMFNVYSDEALNGRSVCVIYYGQLNCTKNVTLTTDVLKKEKPEQIVVNNGYALVHQFKDVGHSSGIIGTASLYIK